MLNVESLVPPSLRKIRPYQAGKSIDEIMEEKGLKRVTKLASNENPIGPSPMAIREATNALWDTHRYPDMFALKIRNALAELYELEIENIILGNGSEGIMAYIVRCFIQDGDEVLTSESTFILFYILAQGAGANLIKTPLTSDYRFDVDAMIEKINDKTKIIYIANPNNPTGTYIDKDEFDRLMDKVPPRVLVILDEAYFEFAENQGDYPDSMIYRYDNVITMRTFSKAYGLSGMRVGYAFGHKDLMAQLYKAKLPFAPNSIAQAGAYGALKDRNHLKRTLWNNKQRYIETFDFLQDLGLKPVPSVTNFIIHDAGSEEAAVWMFQALLNEGVIVRRLEGSALPSFIRVSLGTYEEMLYYYEGMNKIMDEFSKKFGNLI